MNYSFHPVGYLSLRLSIFQLIPHVDVIFLNKHYARAHSPRYAASPRAFLLSFTPIVPAHALLVAHWGSEGAAVLSMPTKEYFQSSGWVDTSLPPSAPSPTPSGPAVQPSATPEKRHGEVQSVRSGSDFWAMGHHTESSSEFTAGLLSSASSDPNSPMTSRAPLHHHSTPVRNHRQRRTRRAAQSDSESSDSDGTQMPSGARVAGGGNAGSNSNASGGATSQTPSQQGIVDEIGAQDAFVAGMMYALSRRMVPGEPYTPAAVSKDGNAVAVRGAEPDRERETNSS